MLTKITAYLALLVAVVAVNLAAVVYTRQKPTPSMPTMGVCVSYNVDTAGTVINSPEIKDSVISCPGGQFVSVLPQPPEKNN